MADTRQVVRWAVQRECVFRNGDNWFLPVNTFQQLADLRTVASAFTDNRVVDGICVTSWTTGGDNTGGYYDIPHDGFRIEDRLGKFGGLSDALKTCAACEANVESKLDTKVAGCFGYLDIWPDSPELEEQLWKIITEQNVEDRLRSAFPITTPLWYGFWIESPLRRLQCEVLHELIHPACDYDDPKNDDVSHFLTALKSAINWELRVHVSLAPLGHTDFGYYTVFPHCPRCKANAPVGRWKQEYPDETYECRVCGNRFNPNEHHSSERDDYDWEATSLEKQLGKHGHEEFIKRFLLHRGCTKKQVSEVIDNRNNGPLLRQTASVRKKRSATLRRLRKKQKPAGPSVPRNITFDLADGVELELVLVPAWEFLMGSPQSEDSSEESPQHLVCFERPFYIGRFPITQEQWQAVMGKNPARYKGEADLPVDQVSWFDCQECCQQLCVRLKRVFRLPSESEWEYTCRAGTTTKFAFGNSLSTDHANFTPMGNLFGTAPESELEAVQEIEKSMESESGQQQKRKSRPTPVGSYPPNAWGVYDMHGNVDEWCEDVWHDSYEGAPTDGSAWLSGEDQQPSRVMRGGWCAGSENVCTSASRRQLLAHAGSVDDRKIDQDEIDANFIEAFFETMYIPYGFRVVCEVG